ncbi:MAG: hypothetical protein ACR2II_02800 [Chthoniobacterales bacterium]
MGTTVAAVHPVLVLAALFGDRSDTAVLLDGSGVGVINSKLDWAWAALKLTAGYLERMKTEELTHLLNPNPGVLLPMRRSDLAATVVALLLGACASTPAPTANQQTHVATVEIVHAPDGAAAFSGLLREAVIREAALYGSEGRPIALRIELTRVHFKNPLQAVVLSDDNDARGEVAVVDPATGQQTSSFEVRVNAERRGVNGADVAMFVAGVADPTGFVDLGTTAATAMSATANRGGTAAAMSANFAIETLRQTYGDDMAKEVAKAREARAKASIRSR